MPELAQQEEWTRLGLSLVDGSTDPLVPGMVAAPLTNLGWSYADEDRWAPALKLFDRVVHVRLASAADAYTLHCARSDRASALRAVGQHSEALTELRQMAATPDGAVDPYVAEEIATNGRSAAELAGCSCLRVPRSHGCDLVSTGYEMCSRQVPVASAYRDTQRPLPIFHGWPSNCTVARLP